MILFDKEVMPPKEEAFFLGFSGGSDSLAAAHFLKQGGWNITLLHVIHFPTADSFFIREGVEQAGWALDLPVEYIHGYVNAPKDKTVPNEANAHWIRSEAISSVNMPVVLCNHLNDLAEGYFMNCMQGFPDRVPLVAVNGWRRRPFLRTKKKDFYRYLEGKSLTHLIVPDDMLSLRGKLRETVFPTLQDDWTSAARKLFIDTGRIY